MSTRNSVSDAILTAFFVCLEDERWWEFKERSTGQPGRVACHTAGNTLTVTIRVGDRLTEQVLATGEVADDETGHQVRRYTLLESRLPEGHMTIRWPGGLVIPPRWRVGQSVSAQSAAGVNPATGGAIKMTATLARVGQLKPPAPQLFGIEITQALVDVPSGTVLGSAQMHFAGSRGVVYAAGQAFGSFFVLEPTAWYGQR